MKVLKPALMILLLGLLGLGMMGTCADTSYELQQSYTGEE